jgi:alginate O-acetyltransferase complex protein AlgI
LSSRRTALVCILIVATLVFYKLRLVSDRTDWLGATAIPLGLSYYAFRCLHYVIEKYKGSLRPHTFGDFAAYLLFLPTIMAGPIHRFPAFQRDLARCRWDSGLFAEGLERILYGYFKIMVIAVYLLSEQAAIHIEGLQAQHPVFATYLLVVQRSLHGFFLFAGYSDVAIGFARLLGFRVMENFNWPFIRRNISDFWRSWHISLTSFVREYAYTPIFAITRNATLAAVISMVLFGLWHELSLKYVLWGAYHGVGIAVWQRVQVYKPRLPKITGATAYFVDALSIILTFHFVVFGFVLMYEPTIASAFHVYLTLLTGWW